MGLTAARFDMMFALAGPGGPHSGSRARRQSELRRQLGVTAPVVTRMVRALEKLGLVKRSRDRYHDRRQIWVELTEAGEKCIVAARGIILRAVRRLVYIAICFGSHRDPNVRFRSMESLESFLRGLRREFGDTATLYYRWGHPDD